MSEPPPLDRVIFLVSRRFPGRWGVSVTKPPFPKSLHDGSSEAIAYEAELRNLPHAELTSLVEAEMQKLWDESDARQAAEHERLYFNPPNSEVDFEHWGRLAHWELQEAVALSFGRSPEKVNYYKMKSSAHTSTSAAAYLKRLQIVDRARVSRQIFDPIRPDDFLTWAAWMEIEVPLPLALVVGKFAPRREDWKVRYEREAAAHATTRQELDGLTANTKVADGKLVSIKERESLLKMVIGMALEKFGYAPDVARLPTTGRIANALRTRGIPLDEDTIRKYLQEGRELLPPDEAEQI